MSDQTYTTQPPLSGGRFPRSTASHEQTADEHFAGGFGSANKQDFASDMLSLKTLPHSVKLSDHCWAVLCSPKRDAVAEMVTSSDFYYSKRGHIFTEMARLATEPLDVIP